MTGFFERLAGGSLGELNLLGRYLGKDGLGADIFGSATLLSASPGNPDQFLPLAPELAVTMPSRTSATITITPAPNPPPRGPLTGYKVYRSLNAGEAVLVQTLAADQLTWSNTGLATATPENVFTYYVVATSDDGQGPPSNSVVVQWLATPPQQPTAPTGLTHSGLSATSVHLSWSETPDGTVLKHGIFQGTTLVVDNIPADATSYDWVGLTPQTAYNNVNVRRYNDSGLGFIPGWSAASNSVQFTTPVEAPESLFTGHVRGRIYLGWSTSNDDALAEEQLNSQSPLLPGTNPTYSDLLGVRRIYSKVTADISRADTNRRVVWISAKGPDLGASAGVAGWSQIANGSRDASIVSYFNSLVSRNKLTVFTFHHEPIGDAVNQATDPVAFCDAYLRIMQVVDVTFPGHKILFTPNYEENRLRNTKQGTINWALWLPEHMMPGRGGPRPWDFISFDMYQYNANTSTNVRQGVEFSHRWWRIDELFTGEFRPNGTSVMPWMTYTPGIDLVYGIGECAPRPGTFYWYESGGGTQVSNMTGAKYARDMWDYIFNNLDKFAIVSTFNSIGADPIYNDERLYPDASPWGGDDPNHPSFVTQTGDTEITLNIYREKLRSGRPIKLGADGLPAV